MRRSGAEAAASSRNSGGNSDGSLPTATRNSTTQSWSDSSRSCQKLRSESTRLLQAGSSSPQVVTAGSSSVSESVAVGALGGGEQGTEPAVGVADEVRPVAEQCGDVGGVDGEVLTGRRWTAAVAATVEDRQAEALVGEWALRFPLLGAGGE